MTYPATNLNEAVGLIVPDSNAFHEIINGGATETITLPEGDSVPTVRKALADSLFFKNPIAWDEGNNATDYLQLRTFTDSLIYWAPTATVSNPIPMGATPVGDNNWKIAPVNANNVIDTLVDNQGEWDNTKTVKKGQIWSYQGLQWRSLTGANVEPVEGDDWRLVAGFEYIASKTIVRFDTITDAANSSELKIGHVVYLKERTTGGGGGVWDVVLASTVTPNTHNIVQCTSIPSLALVLRDSDKSYGAASYGAVSDGETDDTGSIQSKVSSDSERTQPGTSLVNTVYIEGSIDGKDEILLEQQGQDIPTMRTKDTEVSVKKGIRVKGYKLKGPTSQPTNDNAVLTVQRVDGAVITGNEVEQAYNSFSHEYGLLPPAGEERRSVKSVISANIVRGHYLGYEMFSSAWTSLVGNVASSNNPSRGIQHGIRITGYGEDHLGQGHDLRNIGNAYVGNVLHKWGNGISQQTGSYGNITLNAINDCQNGIQFTENTTLPDAISESNAHFFAISNVDYGSFLYDPKSSMFVGTITDASILGWNTVRGARDATSNSYDLNISKATDAAVFRDNNSLIRVVASNLQEGGVAIAGDYNIVDIVIDDQNISGATDAALSIQGAGNIVRFCGYALRQPFSEVIVSGNQNQLEINGNYVLPQGQVTVTGTGNVIRGHCYITAASNSGNDYSGVFGWYKTGTFTGSTDSNGLVSLGFHGNIPQGVTGYNLVASSTEFTNPHNVVRKGSQDLLLIVDAQTGTPIANTTVTIRYTYCCYK